MAKNKCGEMASEREREREREIEGERRRERKGRERKKEGEGERRTPLAHVKGRGEARTSPPNSPRNGILFHRERETIETQITEEREVIGERERGRE